jgi:peptide deformylase
MSKLKGKARDKKRKRSQDFDRQSAERHKKSLVRMIRTFDDPVLKQLCKTVESLEELDEIKQIRQVLGATDNGIGLAAPQIGVLKKIVAIRPNVKSKRIEVLVNPQIIDFLGQEVEVTEGCLSYPGVYCQVQRHNKIKVAYKDEAMKNRESVFRDMEAVIVQHEIDHISDPPKCYVGDHWERNFKEKE